MSSLNFCRGLLPGLLVVSMLGVGCASSENRSQYSSTVPVAKVPCCPPDQVTVNVPSQPQTHTHNIDVYLDQQRVSQLTSEISEKDRRINELQQQLASVPDHTQELAELDQLRRDHALLSGHRDELARELAALQAAQQRTVPITLHVTPEEAARIKGENSTPPVDPTK